MTNVILRLMKYLPWLGVVLLLAGFGMAMYEKEFSQISGALSIAGLVFFLMIFARGESANLKFYVNVVAASLLTLGILVVIYMWVDMRKANWDFTKGQRHSLSDQSVKYVKSLTAPVKLIGLFNKTTRPSADEIKQALDRYAKESGKISVEIVDPVRDNVRVKKLKEDLDTEVNEMELIVLNDTKLKAEQKPRFKKLGSPGEKEITNALIEVTQDKQTVVYVLQGHGEKTLEYAAAGKKQTAISDLVRILKDRAMKVEPLLLRGVVPDDCGVLLVPGPAADLLAPEVQVLKAYLSKGGKAMFFFDDPKSPDEAFPNWAALLNDYGMELSNDLVCDYRGMNFLGDPAVIIASSYDPYHEITKDLTASNALFQGCRAILKSAQAPQGYSVTELIKSSELAWRQPLKELLAAGKYVVPPKEKMSVMPLALASSETSGAKGARLLVFGDADMITDQHKTEMSLVLTIMGINWLTGQEDLVAIPPKELEDTPLFVNEATMSLVFILVVLALPAAVFFGGLSYTMYRRRSR